MVKLWHYSYFIRVLYRTTTGVTQVVFSPWIIDVLRAFYEGCREFGESVREYQGVRAAVRKMERFLRRRRLVGEGNKQQQQQEESCAICQEVMLSCREIKECGHRFHFKCILMWMKGKEESQCPICRRVIVRSRHIWREEAERPGE